MIIFKKIEIIIVFYCYFQMFGNYILDNLKIFRDKTVIHGDLVRIKLNLLKLFRV